jgi:hypothetical protein
VFLLLGISLWPCSAFGYRPFDSTDPVVADPGGTEVEFSPVSFRHEKAGDTWIAPAIRLNYGFAPDWEVVLEGQEEHPTIGRAALVENALSVKKVLQEGSLQEKSGVSLATEAAILLPGINQDSGAGVSLTGIAGERWSWGAIHFNIAGSLNREQHGEVFFGTIVEGPDTWTIRPVAEITYDHAANKEEHGLLAGAIWKATDKLSFDFAIRQAQVDSKSVTEIRTGLDFTFSGL